MTYKIKGKQYTEFDINKRCAELMGSKSNKGHHNAGILISLKNAVITEFGAKNYCNNPSDTWPIIEKCWDELMSDFDLGNDYLVPKWEYIINKHNCTKLVAACICLIEMAGE
jgi:hypothetical protein